MPPGGGGGGGSRNSGPDPRDTKIKELQAQQDFLNNRLAEYTKQPMQSGPFTNRWSMQAVPLDAKGRPLTPEWNSLGDPKTGLLQDQLLQKSQLDTRALEGLRENALRQPGQMSKWGQMALSQAQNQNARMGASQLTQAQNQLAMQGGLRGGSRERLAQQGTQNQLLGNQRALGGIQMQDEQNRLQGLQNLASQELGAAQYQSGLQGQNIERTLNEVFQGRAAQQLQFGEAMKAWAAERTAAATPRSGGKK